MPQGSRTHPRVRDWIEFQAKSRSAADIIKMGPPQDDDVIVENWPQSERTIQSLVKRYRPREVAHGERWRLTPDETDPAPILEALQALIEETRGRLWYLSERQAAWIRVIHRARPEWEGRRLLYLAQAYVNAEEMQEARPDNDLQVGLDHALAYSGLSVGDVTLFEFVDGGEKAVSRTLIAHAARIQVDVWNGPKDQAWLESIERELGHERGESESVAAKSQSLDEALATTRRAKETE